MKNEKLEVESYVSLNVNCLVFEKVELYSL